jgi:hypothetical protein
MIQPTQGRVERRKLDARLDEALAQTFPASDPVSIGHITATEPPSRPVDRDAPLPRAEKIAPRRRLGRASAKTQRNRA